VLLGIPRRAEISSTLNRGVASVNKVSICTHFSSVLSVLIFAHLSHIVRMDSHNADRITRNGSEVKWKTSVLDLLSDLDYRTDLHVTLS